MSEIIGINEIKQRSPFRSPYLMIDRAEISSDGKSARGVKSVSVNEPFFNGHFPKQAIMPGVLQVEAMTQLVSLPALYMLTNGKGAHPEEAILYTLSSIESVP